MDDVEYRYGVGSLIAFIKKTIIFVKDKKASNNL